MSTEPDIDDIDIISPICERLAVDGQAGHLVLASLAGVHRTRIPHWKKDGAIRTRIARRIWWRALQSGRPIPAALLIGVPPELDRDIVLSPGCPSGNVPQCAETAHAEDSE